MMTTRRSLLHGAFGLAGAGFAGAQTASDSAHPFLNILRTPDYASVSALGASIPMARSGGRWNGRGVSLRVEPAPEGLPVIVSASGVEPSRIHLRWHFSIAGDPLVLGDAWERSYGELGWRSIVPERILPWYFLSYSGGVLHGYGVKTQAAALCFWQVDTQGVSLWLDVCNGGSGVRLGDRELRAAVIVSRRGNKDETPMEAATAFCRALCEKPKLPAEPIYGTNDWYYAYSKNSAAQTLRDAELVAGLSGGNRVRPFCVIDMGWKDGSKTFPSMAELAREMKSRKVRPGLWIRPLEAGKEDAANLLLPASRFGKLAERAKELAFDPTIPDALHLITQKASTAAGWGYEMVKHDFSTYDLLGKWGREMGPEPTAPGWRLHDATRTNAEVILDLYKAIRRAAGEQTLLIGCNTIGHLGAGIFEVQRTGDDTSGRVWERTRRMGVNTLAFRLPQHNTFFAVDPDCVGITPAIPWELNRQWLALIADTGVALFISPDPAATGKEQQAAIKEAFTIVAENRMRATPEDWFRDTTPETWVNSGKNSVTKRYHWNDASGALPFDI